MRVKCEACVEERKGKCKVLKATVKPNKSRKCDFYKFDQQKELTRLELKAIAMDNQDAAYARKRNLLEPPKVSTEDMEKFKSTASE